MAEYFNPQWGRVVEIDQPLYDRMAADNFSEWHTGGGCMAWQRDTDEGGYVLITYNECELGTWGERDERRWMAFRYTAESEFIGVGWEDDDSTGLTLDDALRVVDMLPIPAHNQQETVSASVFPRVGDRFELTADVERFPDFIAKAGLRGRVIEIADFGRIYGQMDEKLAGAEEWNNCVIWDVSSGGADHAPFYEEAKILRD